MTKKRHKKALKISLIVFLIILLFGLLGFLWLYFGELTERKFQIFTKLPIPVGIVGKQNIYASELVFYQKLFKTTTGEDQSFAANLQTIIDNKKIGQVAQNLNLQATDFQIKTSFAALAKQENFEKQLKTLGISEDEFQKKFLKYFAEKNNLKTWYNKQENLHAQEYELAKTIQSQAFDKEAFGRLAAKYSQDQGSKLLDGDMGMRETGELQTEIAETLAKLKIGQTAITSSSAGLHILRLESEDMKGLQGAKRYGFKQIFLALSGFEDWLKAASQPIKSKIYLNFK